VSLLLFVSAVASQFDAVALVGVIVSAVVSVIVVPSVCLGVTAVVAVVI